MLVFQMRYVDKTSTVLKQTKNSDYPYSCTQR
ncbi:23S rRNA methyltransferase attenuation leader peptide [Enterococcus faecium]|nr:23S rRNA methyltransferase attenuation leader peptide [Enterococcus faecium]